MRASAACSAGRTKVDAPPPPPPAAAVSVLAAARVVTGHQVHTPGWVSHAEGRVVATGAGRPGRVDRDLGPAVVVPGFVDIHVHGGGGGSFTERDPASALRAIQAHRARGTTTMMASLVSAGPAELLDSVAMLAELHDDGLIAGIHLEGPWLSPKRRGAHDLAALRRPERHEIARLLSVGRGAIQMVTLAPELPGALEAVRQIFDAGALAAIGHTDADYHQVTRAIDAGARVATHLFNAMPPVHHRHPGPVLALLGEDRVTVELIADGTHLDPATYRFVSTAAPDRVALVSDAMAAATLGDGRYQLGSLAVEVKDRVARLAASGAIAGGTATLAQLFRAAATAWTAPASGAASVPDEDLLLAVRQTSLIAARALGRPDIGTLEAGRRADMVVLDEDLRTVEAIAADGQRPPARRERG